jgi:hypothetical protein
LPDSPRVLLDECLPKKLKHEFVNCDVSTVTEMGWAGKKNGELMNAAGGHFDIFITADQNLRYQQNMAYAEVGVIVLVIRNNRIETIMPLMPQIQKEITSVTAGQVFEIAE